MKTSMSATKRDKRERTRLTHSSGALACVTDLPHSPGSLPDECARNVHERASSLALHDSTLLNTQRY